MTTRSSADNLLAVTGPLVTFLSFEWILTRTKRPNGGEIVFLRALFIALLVYLLSIAIKQGLDPQRSFRVDLKELRTEIGASLPVFGAIFAAVYFALYARFASQWTYLANLYNKIKETEVRTFGQGAEKVMAEWKAGFLEDADDLHLATKRVFAPIIAAWTVDPAVEQNFVSHTPGGKARFDVLMSQVEAACNLQSKSYREASGAKAKRDA